MATAKEANGFDQSERKYNAPSLACKLGYSLKTVCEIAVGESLMNEDAGESAQNFRKLFDTEGLIY